MQQTPAPGNDVITFWRIRKAIGILGISLPLLLVLLSAFCVSDTSLQPSISHYYFTNLRDIFTGILCATGLFLLLYKGHKNRLIWKNDSALTNLAGVMAFGIAFFPTCPFDCAEKTDTLVTSCASWLGWFHYGFAAVFFLILAIISLFVFTIGQSQEAGEKSMWNENNIYRTCGWLIILFMALTVLFKVNDWFKYSTLLFEALMLLAFGISWLIKGRVLGYKGDIGRKLYNEIN